MKPRQFALLVLISLFFFSGCKSKIIEGLSSSTEITLPAGRAEVKLEESSRFMPIKTTSDVRVVQAYVNGKGPFNFMVLFEDGTLDPEFTIGIIHPKVIAAIGEKVRFGKIHHAIKSFKVGELELKNFGMEVYAPPAEESGNPLYYMDGAITSGMFKNVKVSFDAEKTLMTVSR